MRKSSGPRKAGLGNLGFLNSVWVHRKTEIPGSVLYRECKKDLTQGCFALWVRTVCMMSSIKSWLFILNLDFISVIWIGAEDSLVRFSCVSCHPVLSSDWWDSYNSGEKKKNNTTFRHCLWSNAGLKIVHGFKLYDVIPIKYWFYSVAGSSVNVSIYK